MRENREFDFNKVITLVYTAGYLAAQTSKQSAAKVIEVIDSCQANAQDLTQLESRLYDLFAEEEPAEQPPR